MNESSANQNRRAKGPETKRNTGSILSQTSLPAMVGTSPSGTQPDNLSSQKSHDVGINIKDQEEIQGQAAETGPINPCDQCSSRDETGRCCGWPTCIPEKGGGAHTAPARTQYDTLIDLNIRVGTVTSAEPHARARKPMHILRVDFGPEIGAKTICAQVTEWYPYPADLVGRQIAAVLNLPLKSIGGIRSEALLLAATDPRGSILLVTGRQAQNGVAVR